jgi:hypothetical protein
MLPGEIESLMKKIGSAPFKTKGKLSDSDGF